jgi:hypothetical protein
MMNWWRRRESNPRPQAINHKVYMLSTLLILSVNCQRAGYSLKSLQGFNRIPVNTVYDGLMKYYHGDQMHEQI